MRVSELVPGDVIEFSGSRGLYIAQAEHPIWPALRLVVWRLEGGGWSHDALHPHQDVGRLIRHGGDPALRDGLLKQDGQPMRWHRV
jgi:hypothetical protein